MFDNLKYRQALKRLSETADGQLVLSSLYKCYVVPTCFDAGSKEATMYALGQKELIQGIVLESKIDEEDITVIGAMYE